MKKFSIVYFSDIYDVNGVNFVTNFFVRGKYIFYRNDLILNRIVSSNGITNIDNVEKIEIGKSVATANYKVKRYIRAKLAKILNSNSKNNAWYKVLASYIKPAEKVISDHIKLLNEEDGLLFQDIFTAYFYLKNKKRNSKVRTVLLLHCERDSFEQLFSHYASLKNTEYENKLNQMKEFVYHNISKVVFLSQKAYDFNKEVLKTKSTYIYNGIEDINVEESDHNGFNIVCLGSMSGHKGQELVVESLALMENIREKEIMLHLIGGGTEYNSLNKLVNDLSLTNNVIFYGIRNDIPQLLKDMDLMVLPSKSEGMPISVLEGMRQGMFILATDVGAISEMINKDFGDFVTRNPLEIEEKILKVYKLSEDEKKSYKKSSREMFLNNFTMERMINKYAILINNLMKDDN